MSDRKTLVKVFYLMDSIPAFRDPEKVQAELKSIVVKRLIGEGAVTLELHPCVTLPGGLEVKVVINTPAKADLSVLRTIERDFVRAIARDQGVNRTFRITTAIDNDAPAETPAPKGSAEIPNAADEEEDIEKRSRRFVPVEPEFSFDRVILPRKTKDSIRRAIGVIGLRKKVFEEWGLYALDKHPSSALNFYGPPGTGKTMSAQAVAHMLGKKILKVSYADIESKWMGEAPKTVRAVFYAAKANDAVLFFDEADSLLSQRITDISHHGDLEVNGTRSEILIQIEQFEGIVIFATNNVDVYDAAALSRLRCVAFERPDAECRQKIWDVHIKSDDGSIRIPLADDVDTAELGKNYEFAGREIKRAVISACLAVAERDGETVGQADFVAACEEIAAEKQALRAQQEAARRVARRAVEESEKEKAEKEKDEQARSAE